MYDRKAIMQTAWSDARRRADMFGTKVRDQLKLAMKQAWAAAKGVAAVLASIQASPTPPTSTFAERTWAPQLAAIAAREAAGTSDEMDAAVRLAAAESIAQAAASVAHMDRRPTLYLPA